jgi:hypothetical protein
VSFEPAIIVTSPAPMTLPGGHVVYTAKATSQITDNDIEIVILPDVDGQALPYKLGDMVLLGVSNGTGYVLKSFTSAVVHDGNTMLVPRTGKKVQLGVGAGAWEAMMLYELAHAEMNELRATLADVVLPGLSLAIASLATLSVWATGAPSVPLPTPLPQASTAVSDAATISAKLAALAAYHGGDPSGGVQGRTT